MDESIKEIIGLTAELAAKKAIGPVHEKINKVDKAVARIETRISVIPDVYQSIDEHLVKCSQRRNRILSLFLGIPAVCGAVIGVFKYLI